MFCDLFITRSRSRGDAEHIDGSMSLAESADALAAMVADTASGTPSKSEALGHKEFHILYKYQSKEVLPCES